MPLKVDMVILRGFIWSYESWKLKVDVVILGELIWSYESWKLIWSYWGELICWYVSGCCWWPWKLICSYWARPWRTSVSAKLPPFDGKNGPTKCCNPTLCDLFRQIWTFLWKSVLHGGERQGLSVSMCFLQVHATETSGGWMIDSDWLSATFVQSTQMITQLWFHLFSCKWSRSALFAKS